MKGPGQTRGQVLPVLMLALFASVVVMAAFGSSRATLSKMTLVNAADAAAYSGGLQAARSMNVMAYTTRAMVSNTIGVGYMVAYVSHLRYLGALVDRISTPRQTFALMLKYYGESLAAQGKAFTQYNEQAQAQNRTAGEGGETAPLFNPDGTPNELDGRADEGDGIWNTDPNSNEMPRPNNKFERAGRIGSKAMDRLATLIGYGTIPLIDMVNTAYAGIQMAEYAAMGVLVRRVAAGVAASYGSDIELADAPSAAFMTGWMLPVRPGLDGFLMRLPKQGSGPSFNVGALVREALGDRGGVGGKALGSIQGLVLKALGTVDLSRKRSFSLSPMNVMIDNAQVWEDKSYMKYKRAWRVCMRLAPGQPMPFAPIPTVPLSSDYANMDESNTVMTPPCTAPFVLPTQVAFDRSGGATYIQSLPEGAASGAALMEERRKRLGSGPDHQPSRPTGGRTGASGARIEAADLSTGNLDDLSETDSAQRARTGGSPSEAGWRAEGGDGGPAGPGAGVAQRFRNRFYNSEAGKQAGLGGWFTENLGYGALWGADWQSEDRFRVGGWVWRPTFQKRAPWVDVQQTMYDSGFDLKDHDIAVGSATAKAFWPNYQGVAMYMALAEIPWQADTDLGLPNTRGRVIRITVRQPLPMPANGILPLGHPADGALQARAAAQVFYYRQPEDADTIGSDRRYFPVPGDPSNRVDSAFARIAKNGLQSDTKWFDTLTNWYGQYWARNVVERHLSDKLADAFRIRRELPNLMTPLWDARLVPADV